MSQDASSIRERFRFLSAAFGQDAEALHVLRFSGTEGFSRLFSFDVSLATRRKKLNVDAILANPAALCILRSGGGMARFTGYPTSLELSSSYGGWQFWTLRLQPALWKLTQQVESRIFLDCTVEELAKEVLDKASSLQIDCDSGSPARTASRNSPCSTTRASTTSLPGNSSATVYTILYLSED